MHPAKRALRNIAWGGECTDARRLAAPDVACKACSGALLLLLAACASCSANRDKVGTRVDTEDDVTLDPIVVDAGAPSDGETQSDVDSPAQDASDELVRFATCESGMAPSLLEVLRAWLKLDANEFPSPLQLDFLTLLDASGATSLVGVECITGLAALSFDQRAPSDLAPIAALSLSELSFRNLADIAWQTMPAEGALNLSLKRLEVVRSQLSSAALLPDFPALTHLVLADDGLTSSEGLSRFSSLRVLDLSNNSLSELLGLVELQQLEQLNVEHNALTSLEGLAAQPLTRLRAGFNALVSFEADELSGLQELGLSHNSLTRMPNLPASASLTSIDVSSNALTNIEGVERHPMLVALDVSSNPIADLQPLQSLTAMRLLRLTATDVVDIDVLSSLAALETLSLEATDVTELEPLAGLRSMTELWLSHSRVQDLTPLLPWTEGDHECRRLHLDGLSLTVESADSVAPQLCNAGWQLMGEYTCEGNTCAAE